MKGKLEIINHTDRHIELYCHQIIDDGHWGTKEHKKLKPGERGFIDSKDFIGNNRDGVSIEEDLEYEKNN